MSDNCCEPIQNQHGWDCRYRQILRVILLINASMFVVEIISGVYSGSQALLADALDFFSDAANYAISIFVLNKSLTARAKASLIKGSAMGLFGLWIMGSTFYQAFTVGLPKAEVMGTIGFLALMANVVSALLLYKYRKGDSNRMSVWICSRNDALTNIAVILAAGAVFFTQTKWPDLIVAVFIAGIALSGSWRIIRSAVEELKFK